MKEGWNISNYFIGLVVTVVAVQIISWILSKYSEVEILNLGWAILLLTAITGVVSLFIMGRKIGELQQTDIIFIILEIAGIVAIFNFLPQYVPEIFSVLS